MNVPSPYLRSGRWPGTRREAD